MRRALAVIAILAGFTLAVAITATATREPVTANMTEPDHEPAALAACHAAVLDVLKAPGTAQWPGGETIIDTSSSYQPAYTIHGTVDSENGFGALMRVDWTCDTRLTSTGWHAELTYAEQR